MDRHLERVIGSHSEAARRASAGFDERVLRAKYLDWCSARIAERFLQLTPDEIYELAQKASREVDAASPDASVASGAARRAWSPDTEPVESFRWIVERVTEVLASTVSLPSFDEWQSAYRDSPARYDEELLGFWKETLKG